MKDKTRRTKKESPQNTASLKLDEAFIAFLDMPTQEGKIDVTHPTVVKLIAAYDTWSRYYPERSTSAYV